MSKGDWVAIIVVVVALIWGLWPQKKWKDKKPVPVYELGPVGPTGPVGEIGPLTSKDMVDQLLEDVKHLCPVCGGFRVHKKGCRVQQMEDKK